MSNHKNLLVALGLAATLSSPLAVRAQADTPDPDFMALDGEDRVAVADPGLLVAGPLPPRPGGFSGRGPCPMSSPGVPFASLEGEHALTDEQYEKLFALKNQFLDKVGPKLAEAMASERDLRDLMTRPQPDRAKIKELQTRINGQKAELANARLDYRLASLDVLTEEQRKEMRRQVIKGGMGLKEMIRKRHVRFREQNPAG